jgi:hypothetical protein
MLRGEYPIQVNQMPQTYNGESTLNPGAASVTAMKPERSENQRLKELCNEATHNVSRPSFVRDSPTEAVPDVA